MPLISKYYLFEILIINKLNHYLNFIFLIVLFNFISRRICCVCNDYILSGTAKIVIESKQLFKVDVTNVICHLKCLHTYCSKGGDDRKFGMFNLIN